MGCTVFEEGYGEVCHVVCKESSEDGVTASCEEWIFSGLGDGGH